MKDRGYFYKINKDEAYQVLREVGVNEDMLEETYHKLVNRVKYDDLIINEKLNPNDAKVIIKF